MRVVHRTCWLSLRAFWLVAICLFMAGCSMGSLISSDKPAEEAVTTSAVATSDSGAVGRRLQAGDRISMEVQGRPDLSGEYALDQQGAASLPLIGTVQLAGLGLYDARRFVEDRYAIGYITNPVVFIKFSE